MKNIFAELQGPVKTSLNLLNEVLVAGNQSEVPSNEAFIVDPFSTSFYLKLDNARYECINFSFIISISGLQIDIDRVSESFDWSSEQVNEKYDYIKEVIQSLLFSTIELEYRGKTCTVISFVNSQGQKVSYTHSNALFAFKSATTFTKTCHPYFAP